MTAQQIHPHLTIAVIDDCAEDRAVYRRYLQCDPRHHWQINEFETGTEALEWCQNNPPDAILLDYQLPDINGLEVLQELQPLYNTNPLPVIMLTGQGNEFVAVQSMKNGALDYLIKGKLTREILSQAMHSLVERGSLLQQLQQQQQQQQLIATTALHIRQSLQLDIILETTVHEVRQFLQADRVIIYQFQEDSIGKIVAEAVLPQWISCLDTQIQDSCFQENYSNEYRYGKIATFSNIYEAGLTQCHIQLLETFQVKASLMVPIVLNTSPQISGLVTSPQEPYLWGLLMAHQCDKPRHWHQSELELMSQLAINLAIALQQAELYNNLQLLNTQLEQKVEERTAELLQNERKFRAIFNNTFHFTGLITPEGILLEANQTALDFGGLQLSDVINRPFWEAYWWTISPETQLQLQQAIQQARQGEFIRYEVDVLGANQRITTIDFSLRPLKDESGKVVLLIPEGRDISDRKKAEQALKERERKFRHLFNSAFNFITLLNPGGYILEANTTALNIGELSLEQVLNQLIWETPWVKDLPESQQRLKQQMTAATQGQFCRFEIKIRGQKQQILYLDISYKPLFNEQGEVEQILAEGRDITEQKQIELALKESEERYRLVILGSGEGLWAWDLQNNGAYISPRYKEILGYKNNELPPKYSVWENAIHPDDREQVLGALNQHFSTRSPYKVEYRLRRKDGNYCWVFSTGQALWDETGKAIRMAGSIQDITARKLAETQLQSLTQELQQLNRELEQRVEERTAALRDSEARFRLLAENSIDMISRESVEGITLYISPSCQTLLGYEPEERIGCFSRELVHPEDLPQLSEKFNNIYVARQNIINTFRMRHKQGHYLWFEAITQPIFDSQTGTLLEFHSVSREISDRKKMEDELRQANEQLSLTNVELARATRLKDEFLANMSHELRTPLNAILGLTEALQEGIYAPLQPPQKRALERVYKSGKHLLSLINDILDLAKIEAGKTKLEIAPTNVRFLCQSSLTFVEEQAYQKSIKLQLKVARDLPNWELDERRIRQVLINLLSNAVKFTPDGGIVKLEAKMEGKTALLLSVTDTGIGIPEEAMSRLFQAFFQIDSSLSRAYEGTGLGLALVKQLTEMHGGTVSIQSTVGQGSCFTIHLPFNHSIDQDYEPIINEFGDMKTSGNALQFEQQKPLILVAEDNLDNIHFLEDYLTYLGYRIVIANNGKEAITMAQNYHPNLILMDIQMPEMNGLDAIKKIRADEHCSNIPIIALTALAMPGDLERCLDAGADDYLAKPVSLQSLKTSLQQWIGGNRE